MRESEMVEKIIREWENLSDEKKNKFARNLGNNEPLPQLGVEATPSKNDRTLSLAKTNQKTTGAKENRVEESSEEDREELDGSSSNNVLFPKVTPKINKNGSKADYMTFFKFYYARTMRDHPNWTPNQATVIIKLLWKKRLTDLKKKPDPKKSMRCMSGREAFGKAKKMEGLRVGEIAKMWRRLPLESRKVWEKIGNPSDSRAPQPCKSKATMRLRVNKNPDGFEEENHLTFLSRK